MAYEEEEETKSVRIMVAHKMWSALHLSYLKSDDRTFSMHLQRILRRDLKKRGLLE